MQTTHSSFHPQPLTWPVPNTVFLIVDPKMKSVRVCVFGTHITPLSYWLVNRLKPQSSCFLTLQERRNIYFSEMFFPFGTFFSTQTTFGILILLVLSKAFISPSVVSSDNLKRLPADCWCIYLVSGLEEGDKSLLTSLPNVCWQPAYSRLCGVRRRTKLRAWLSRGRWPRGGRSFGLTIDM